MPPGNPCTNSVAMQKAPSWGISAGTSSLQLEQLGVNASVAAPVLIIFRGNWEMKDFACFPLDGVLPLPQ